MPENVILPDSPAFTVSDYVQRLHSFGAGDVKFRGSAFDDFTNHMSTADARVIANYMLALCDEIDSDPKYKWVTNGIYLDTRFYRPGDSPVIWQRVVGGWCQVGNMGNFCTDDDVAWNTDWLDKLVLLVRKSGE